MTDGTLSTLLWPALTAGSGGFLLGLLYFRLLRDTAERLVAGGGWPRAALFTVLRIAGAVAVLGLAAQAGPLPLLAAFFGFLAARLLFLRLGRRDA